MFGGFWFTASILTEGHLQISPILSREPFFPAQAITVAWFSRTYIMCSLTAPRLRVTYSSGFLCLSKSSLLKSVHLIISLSFLAWWTRGFLWRYCLFVLLICSTDTSWTLPKCQDLCFLQEIEPSLCMTHVPLMELVVWPLYKGPWYHGDVQNEHQE